MKRKRTLRESLLPLLAVPVMMTLLISACSDSDNMTPINPPIDDEQNLAEVLAGEEDYSILVSLVTEELLAALQSQELTVFAPTNAAFGDIPQEVLESLTEEQVVSIITYHLVAGTTLAAQVPAQADLETVNGELILIQSNNGVTLNGSSDVVEADLTASNGVIHGIDQVLLPSEIRKALDLHNIVDRAEEVGGFETLLGAVEATGLKTTLQFLSPFTVFAPTDDAFDALPAGLLASLTTDQIRDILLYHVLGAAVPSSALDAEQAPESLTGEALYITAGNDGVNVNGSAGVIAADVEASNGVIHAVDEVLIPNNLLNIVEIAQKNYGLTTLVDLVVQFDLAETLSGDGPFTVFAPVNSAFDEVSDALGTLSEEEIAAILTYHVIASEILSGDIPAGTTMVETVQGQEVTIVNDNGTVTVDGATVITVDLHGTNGVIHLIDAVIIPADEE